MNLIKSHTKELVRTLREREAKGIRTSEVFLVACGGSLVDLYPSKYFLSVESSKLRSDIITSNEFAHKVPKALGEQSIVIFCSHSGQTPEVLEALKIAKSAGSLTVTLTHNKVSKLGEYSGHNIVYEWGDESKIQNNPMAICLALCLEILHHLEGYSNYQDFHEGLKKIDDIVVRARKKIEERVLSFAEAYQDQDLFYILSSGASYGHAYGFAICSLMEMQWLNASAIHSGEFFHGPFEITDEEKNFILLVNEGKTRRLDLRVLTFLQRYARKYIVIDAKELGLGILPEAIVDFFNPVLFYSVLCDYREALAKIRNHPLDKRRYMGIVDY